MKTRVAIAMLMCTASVCANADNQDIQIRYDKNSYLKNLEITPEIEADMKAHKESLLYVVKRNERNYQKIFADSLVAVTAKIEAIENDMQNIERLKDLQGKKYSSDDDREFVSRQIELYVAPAGMEGSAQRSYNQTRYTNSISVISGAFKAAKEDIAFSNLQKNALKELKKNKIGEKTVSILAYRMVALENEKNTYNQRKETLTSWQQHEPTSIKSMLWFDPDRIDEYFVCNDTIVNLFHPTVVREKQIKLFKENPSGAAHVANASVDEGWEWVLNEKGTRIDENFPRQMTYYRYDSHPDLRIVEANYEAKSVYDKNGNLVAVVQPKLGQTANADRFDKGSMGPLVARFAYENNDHDIQSYDAHTLHYVKNQLGLEELTAKEKAASKALSDGIATATANYMRDNAKYGSRTKKGRQAQYKNAGNIVGAMLSAGSSGYYSSTGSNWFDQIKRDYSEIYVFERERIDGLTFRSVYADKDANPLFEIIVRYEEDNNSVWDFQLKKTYQLKKCSKTDKAE